MSAFLDREFDGIPGVASEFPLLIGEANPGRCIVLLEGEEIAAHAAWRPMTLKCVDRRIAAAGIGLVTTGGAWRGRGLASRAVEACLERALASGADLALLFGKPTPLYERLGFVQAGRERIVRLDPRPTGPDSAVRAAIACDAPQLARLLSRAPVGVERSAEEFAQLLKIPGTHAYVLDGPCGARAYCVEGKGRDLCGVVHEWAGDPEAVAQLLSGLAAGLRRALWVLSPECMPAPISGESTLGPLAMFRVLRPERLGSDDPRELFGDPQRSARVPVYVWGLDSV